MRPSSLGGGRILRRTLSVRLSVRPVNGSSFLIGQRQLADVWYLLFCLHLRAAYCRAISRTSLFFHVMQRHQMMPDAVIKKVTLIGWCLLLVLL